MASLSAIIMAAGRGTRLGGHQAKALMPVAQRSMVEHVVMAVRAMKNPPSSIIVVCHEDDYNAMQQLLSDVTLVVQKSLKGTADAAQTGLKILKEQQGMVMLIPTDMPLITSEFLDCMVERASSSCGSLSVMTPLHNHGYGRVLCDGEQWATAIIEEKDADEKTRKIPLVYGGIMVMDIALLTKSLQNVEKSEVSGEYYLTECVRLMNECGGYKIAIVHGAESMLLGVNLMEQWAEAERIMQKRLIEKAYRQGVIIPMPDHVVLSADGEWGEGVIIHPFVFLGQAVRLENHVVVESFSHLSDVHVGEGSVIGPFARLRGGAHIGRNVRIGNFVEGKNVTMGDGVKAAHLSYLGDATIEEHSNIGAGVITCNYDGKKKHRTHIGKNAFVGSHVSLIAPVTIGDGAVIGAGSVITRDVSDNALALARAQQIEKKKKIEN